MLRYKNYVGKVEYDGESKIFYGVVINLKDVITFQGTSVDEIEKAFRESIDDYLEWCKNDGVEPEKPYSGKFIIRITPELHQKLDIASSKQNTSINKYVVEVLEHSIQNNLQD